MMLDHVGVVPICEQTTQIKEGSDDESRRER